MYYGILIDVTLVYNIIHGKAFRIPDLFKQAVNAELEELRKGKGAKGWVATERDALTRQFRSVPFTGFKVGQFHTLERT